MWLEIFHFLAFPDLLKMAFFSTTSAVTTTTVGGPIFRWFGHMARDLKKTGLGISDPRVYFSTELRWPGLHSWRWGHGGDVDVLVGDVFVFKVLIGFDVWWGVWRLDVTEKCYSCDIILFPPLILMSKQQEQQDIRVTALPVSGGKFNVPTLVRIA